MNLKETLKTIIDKGTGEVIDDCVLDRIVKKILKFKDEWNTVVEEHIYEFNIPFDELGNKSTYRFVKWITVEMKKKIKEKK